MAIEIAFGVRGKSTKQALFIREADWDSPLSDLRKIVEEHDLHVPVEYKFLTVNGNAIAQPSEPNLTVRDVTVTRNGSGSVGAAKLLQEGDSFSEPAVKTEEESEESETEKKLKLPEIWIIPLKVSFNSKRQGDSVGGEAREDETESLLQEGGAGGANSRQTPGDSPGTGRCTACPFTALKNLFQDHGNPTKLFKILLVLTVMLFAALASLMLTMHMMMHIFSGFAQGPAVNELFSKVTAESGGSSFSEKMIDFQVKLSQMEMSSKFEVDKLNKRITELEDLYLRDLAVHKKELSLLKKRMSVNEEDIMMEDFEQQPSKKYENKKTKAKSGDKKKG